MRRSPVEVRAENRGRAGSARSVTVHDFLHTRMEKVGDSALTGLLVLDVS